MQKFSLREFLFDTLGDRGSDCGIVDLCVHVQCALGVTWALYVKVVTTL